MAGGAIGTGVIVDFSRLNRLGRFDPAARTMWAEPGVLWSKLDAAAKERGLRLPVDPSSGSFCTLGGMVSTNAAGARSLRYGAMRKWVNALDCVFSDGDRAIITRGEEPSNMIEPIRRFLREAHAAIVSSDTRHPARHKDVRKESSGYGIHQYADKADLLELLVGSEGTLAMIVGVQVTLSPIPAATSTVLGSFKSLGDATAAAGKAVEAGASACELLDRTFLAYAAKAPGADDEPASTRGRSGSNSDRRSRGGEPRGDREECRGACRRLSSGGRQQRRCRSDTRSGRKDLGAAPRGQSDPLGDARQNIDAVRRGRSGSSRQASGLRRGSESRRWMRGEWAA